MFKSPIKSKASAVVASLLAVTFAVFAFVATPAIATTKGVNVTTRGGQYYFTSQSTGAKYTGWYEYNGKYGYVDNGYLVKYTTFYVGDSNDTYIADANGILVKNGWVKQSGRWYYVENYKVLLSQTKYINGKEYAFDENGCLYVNCFWKFNPTDEYWRVSDENGCVIHDCKFNIKGESWCYANKYGNIIDIKKNKPFVFKNQSATQVRRTITNTSY